MNVSGGYGANATGTTDTNGYFAIAIMPTNIGGPFPITVSSGTWSEIVGTLKVIPKPPTLSVTSLSGTSIADVNVPYSILVTLSDSDGTPITGVEVKLDISTDGNADYPKSISTDSSGNALFIVRFNKVSNQSLNFSCTTNGKSLNSTLYLYSAIPIVGNFIYQSVTPTTIEAGNTLSLSGFVFNQFGNPMPPNTGVSVTLPGSNASTIIAYTTSSGSFSASLTPTKVGSYTLGCTVDSSTFNYGTTIIITAGTPTTGALTYSLASVPRGSYNTAYIHLSDDWGNNVPNATVTLGTNASVTVTQPPKTDANGNTSVSVGPFNSVGSYNFHITSPISLTSTNFSVYNPVVLTSITSSPSSLSISKGSYGYITVTAHYSDGSTTNVTSSASYSSNNPSVASGSSGSIYGSSAGSASISVSYGGYGLTVSVSVYNPKVLTKITVSPTGQNLWVGWWFDISVTAHYSDGSTTNVSNLASFSSSNPSVVNPSGPETIKGISVGSATISVSYGGYTAFVGVNVVPF